MNWKRPNDISLKWKLLIPFLFLAAAGAASLFLVSYRFQTSLIHINEEQRLRNLYQVFLNQVDAKKNMALSLATLAAQNPEVAAALARRDRNRLMALLLPPFKTLERDFGVRQFHFHIPPATSFLRLHALDQNGENMESFRPTINRARETGVGVGGIERGVLGLSIRSVVPVFHRGHPVGTVEFGLSLERPLLEEFKRHYQAEATIFIQEKDGPGGPRVLASTIDRPYITADLFRSLVATQELFFQAQTWGDRKVATVIGPVRDFSTRTIGVLQLSVDRSLTLAMLQRYGLLGAGIGLLGLAASVFFVWFISAVFTRRIDEVVQGADEIASGRRDTRLTVKSADELGVMAGAINQMLASLEESQGRLRDYAQNLEVMVDQRTRSLKASEKTYRTLVENVPLIVYMVMPDGSAVFLNRSTEQMLGIPPEALNGPLDAWAENVHPEDRARFRGLRAEALRDRKELHTDYRLVHRDGRPVYCLDHAVPVFDEEREFIRLDGIVIDVTVQKELQEKNLQTQELETLSQISTRLAHELRNPLTAIGGLSRRLFKTLAPSGPQADKAVLILEQIQKLEKIVDMMLAFIETKAVKLLPADINRVIGKAIEGLGFKFRDNGFSVKFDPDQSIGEIPLDSDLFEAALISLMENAWYRMGQQGELAVSTQKNGDTATVTLTFPVPSITEDDIEHYFFPFTVDYPGSKNGGDLHLRDVSIPKVVIHRHGGLIQAAQENSRRIRITISLPLS